MFVVGKVGTALVADEAIAGIAGCFDTNAIFTGFAHCRAVVAAGTAGRIRSVGDTRTIL